MLSPRLEAKVVKTLVGIVALALRGLGDSDAKSDFDLLMKADREPYDEIDTSTLMGSGSGGAQEDGEEGDREALTQRMLRDIFGLSRPKSAFIPSVKNFQTASNETIAAWISPKFEKLHQAADRERLLRKGGEGGSVEDLIRGGRAPVPAGEERKGAESAGEAASNHARVPRSIGQIQTWQLPINVREALRFRIRRKREMGDLLLSLGEVYKVLHWPSVVLSCRV